MKLGVEGVTRVTELKTLYIIDYDIPRDPASNRVAFYRHLAKLKKAYGYEGESSRSVLKTRDSDLAFRIYELALSYGGRANVWKATKLTDLL